ncbi:MAG: SMC-Scp complex subunit ScpB [Candidatus Acidiferrum sp.]|jgi:segregation and condensation protein B
MTSNERKAALEAIIYAADEPATIDQLATALGEDKIAVQNSLDELVASYASDERGIEIRAVAGGYKMYTKPQHHDVVRRFIKSLRPPLRLSMPALETLAVIAYKQPVTAPEISEIRGVNTSGVISTLLDKKLITTAGRKEVMGRPILYKSSKEFLMRFGLSDLDELPSLKEFEALAREALGTDEGISSSESTDEALLNSPNADTLENLPVPESSANVFAATHRDAASSADANPATSSSAGQGTANSTSGSDASTNSEADEFLREEEVTATNEGMPSGILDEEPPPPNAKSTTAGE